MSALGSGTRALARLRAALGARRPARCACAAGRRRPRQRRRGAALARCAFGAACVALGPGLRRPASAPRRCARAWARSSPSRSRAWRASRELPGRARRAGRRAPGEPLRGPAASGRRSLVGAEREGLPARGRRGLRRASRHIPIASRVAQRGDGGDGRAVRVRLGSRRRDDRAHRQSCAAQAEAAIAAADSTRRARGAARALPRPQGRAAATCCAASPSCRPRSAARWQGGQPGAPGARGADRGARAASSRRGELDARLAADRVDVTLPGEPPQPVGRLHLLTATRRELEDVFVGLGFTVVEGPEVETVHYNFDALNHSATHPARDRTDTFYVGRRRGRCAPTPRRCRSARWRPTRRRCTSSSPGASTAATTDATHTPSSTRSRAWPSTRTSPSPTSRARCWPSRARCSARTARCACARTSSRSPSRGRGRRVVLPLRRQGLPARRLALQLCKGEGWLEILGAGDGRPERLRLRATSTATTPSRSRASPSGMGIERIAMLKHGVPDLRLFFDNDLRFLEQFG